MTFDLVIKNGTVVTAVSSFPADIGINGETIAAVGQGLSGRHEIDAAGKLVTPGAVDIHVHLQMPIGRFVSTDDFYTGTVAAAFGGTTTLIDFVETQPAETMTAAITARRALADPRVVIDYGLHMTITPADIAKLAQLPEAFAAGCTTFKLYMAYGHRLDDGQLLRALTAVRDVGGLPVVHAENWDVILALMADNLAHGRSQPHWHPRSRPARIEAEATGRVIDLAAFVGVPLHIFHVSCTAAVERMTAARQLGLPVTGETCPQYLFLTQEVYDQPGVEGALPVCSPPIREQQEQDALWQAVSRGDLQVITTDHCPFTRAEKATGLADYSRIPGGVPSIEMRFAAIYARGVKSGLLTAEQWVDRCCTTPAKLAGLEKKGHIAPGYEADLVIFDPTATFLITPQTLHETAGWTPYDGLTLHGRVQTTLVRGQVVVADGELKVGAGYGRYIQRTRANL
jgi:dihydropyrimidinase